MKSNTARTTLALALLSSGWAAVTTQGHAQGGVPLWTNRYHVVAGGYDQAFAAAVDNSGNVFVTGYSWGGPPDFDGSATIKYSSAGVPLWTNRHTASLTAIAITTSGNVVVTGKGYTLAYSNAGVPLWANTVGSGGLVPDSIAVDGSGDVFVMVPALGGAGRYAMHYRTLAYSGAGVPLWENSCEGPDEYTIEASAIAADSSGYVFITAPSCGTIAYSNTGTSLWTNDLTAGSSVAVDGNGKVFVTGDETVALSSTEGLRLWTSAYPGNHNEFNTQSGGATDIAVDVSGNVLLTGRSYSPNGSNIDYATVAYSNTGVPLWTNRYGPASGYEVAAIAVDSGGNVFVAAQSYGPSIDFATVAYSAAGVPLWTNRYNGWANSHDYATAIAVDSRGNVFVTGYSATTNSAPWNYEFVTIKYSSSLPPPVHLGLRRLNNQLVLSWTNAAFRLQSAPGASGVFTNIPGATSPYTNSLAGQQQFFRLISY